MHGAFGAMGKIDREARLSALRLMRDRVGGIIKGHKLYPIAPVLTPLRPLEPDCTLQRSWHVVQTQPQQEGKVTQEFVAAKLDAYCPQQPSQVRVNANRHRTVMRPMLPGYVFAGFDVGADNWEVIPTLKGVVRLLMIELRPVPIAEAVISRLREIEVSRAGGRTRKPISEELKPGVLIRVLDPISFAGLFGFVTDLNHEKGQVCVELEIFKRLVPLWIFPEQVEVV